jgi:hypothetical protein
MVFFLEQALAGSGRGREVGVARHKHNAVGLILVADLEEL